MGRDFWGSDPAPNAGYLIKEIKMATAMSVVNGFCFGVGMILAAAAMRVILHVGFCG